jgi:DNA-binding response OmpR family regulator
MRILLVEDNPAQARLLWEYLSEAPQADQLKITHTLTLREMRELLKQESFDAILLDLTLPDSRGLDTLLETQKAAPALPIVVQTNLDDEQTAIRAVQAGAQDYLVKGQITGQLLVRSLRYAIERKRGELERSNLIRKLTHALEKIQTLRGLLPICTRCKKIRDDEGYWHQVEVYIRDHSEAEFSHGFCPDCARELYPQFYDD